MLKCSNCHRMYSSGSVVNIKSTPVDFTAEEWTDAGKRKTNYMFLYGPDEPPFLGAKDPCEPSNPKKRCCSLVDLQVYVAVQATVLLPVQLIAIPPIVGPTITHTNPVHVKPTWNFPAPLPTVLNALSYANGTCQNCQKDNWHTLTESPRTRWAAATIHAYLGVLAVPSNPGFMLGVLINDEERLICVAYSSNSSSDNAHANLNGCKFTGYKLKLYGNEGFADIDTCRGGKDIRKHRNLSMVNVGSTGQRSSETCAASKLVKKYVTKAHKVKDWNMTEIAYGTMTGYTNGVPAQSCAGCKAFLPTLLCWASE